MFGKKIDIGLQAHHIALTMKWSNGFTPDIVDLERKEKQLLFVHDDWMSDRRNSHILKEEPDYRWEGKAFTQHGYRFYDFNGYGERTAVAFDGLTGGKKILGEVVSLRPSSFRMLDRVHGNMRQFVRRRVHLIYPRRDQIVFENTLEDKATVTYLPNGVVIHHGKFPDGHPLAGKKRWVGPEKVYIITAWMYMGRWEYWNYPFSRNIAQFFEQPRFKPKNEKKWLSEYYKYRD